MLQALGLTGIDQSKVSRICKELDEVVEPFRTILAYTTFPPEHWSRIYSTNPLERLNKEIKRRTYIVGVFPDEPSVIRLVGSVLMEIADEWQVSRRYFPGLSGQDRQSGVDAEAAGSGTRASV